MTNIINERMVYQVECPDDRNKEKEPNKRYHFEICADSFLPIYPLKNYPTGGLLLRISQMYAGRRYETIKDGEQIERELAEKLGGFLLANNPGYLVDITRWTKPIKLAVEQTVKGRNYVWRGQQPVVAPKQISLKVVEPPQKRSPHHFDDLDVPIDFDDFDDFADFDDLE